MNTRTWLVFALVIALISSTVIAAPITPPAANSSNQAQQGAANNSQQTATNQSPPTNTSTNPQAPATPEANTASVAQPAAGSVTQRVNAIFQSTNDDNKPLALFQAATSDDGTMARIPLERNEVDGTTAVIQSLAPTFNGAQVFVSSQLGMPMLIISGSSPDVVQDIKNRVLFALGKNTKMPKMLVEISASLKEYTESEAENIGIPIIPTSLSNVTGTLEYNNQQTPAGSVDFQGTLNFQDISLYNNNDVGKVLVGSNVVTGNGVMCNLSSTDNTPILISQSGSVTASNRIIQTTVQVTPTILSYDANSLAKSLVKLGVQVQLSVPTATVTMDNTSANAFTQKNLQTVRVLPANGTPILAGSFISDVDQKTKMFIPILGQIPLLSYFFSYETTQRQRQISILMLSVRLLPEEMVVGTNPTE